MIKYVKSDVQVTFTEVPDEIALCINLSLCPHHCKGCFESYLQTDCGEELTEQVLQNLINSNKGISCVCFFGGDNDPETLNILAGVIKNSGLKSAVYSGNKVIDPKLCVENFDYIKIGPWKEEFGPLNKKSTNQRLYRVENKELIDITFKFWK